jgi:hypothetical protein
MTATFHYTFKKTTYTQQNAKTIATTKVQAESSSKQVTAEPEAREQSPAGRHSKSDPSYCALVLAYESTMAGLRGAGRGWVRVWLSEAN